MTDEQIQRLDAWAVYLEIRKAKNRLAPFTPGAEKRILAKLRMLSADGQNVEEILWNSVENGWTGVFEVKRKGWQHDKGVTVPASESKISKPFVAEPMAQQTPEQRAATAERLKAVRAKITGVA